jgi:ketosteroid isomerase-like protein
MVKYFLFSALVFLLSCTTQHSDHPNAASLNKDSLLKAMMDADKSWSDLAGQKGFNRSRVDFAEEKAINLMSREMPLVGREAIMKYANTHPDSGYVIRWHPLKGDLAESGDLGYTYGSWTMNTKTGSGRDTSIYGNYVTVWKRQHDGSWKYLIDGGGSTPEEVKE